MYIIFIQIDLICKELLEQLSVAGGGSSGESNETTTAVLITAAWAFVTSGLLGICILSDILWQKLGQTADPPVIYQSR